MRRQDNATRNRAERAWAAFMSPEARRPGEYERRLDAYNLAQREHDTRLGRRRLPDTGHELAVRAMDTPNVAPPDLDVWHGEREGKPYIRVRCYMAITIIEKRHRLEDSEGWWAYSESDTWEVRIFTRRDLYDVIKRTDIRTR